MLVLGLMSGTSADGIEAVLAEFIGNPISPKWQIINQVSTVYPSNLSKRVIAAGQNQKLTGLEFLSLSEAVTEEHAKAAWLCDPKNNAQIIGCHGQTISHQPPIGKKRGASLQLLQASLFAQLLQKPLIHDFRAADMAQGGHGAPLVPMVDQALIGRTSGWRGVLNLGGISNITLIPPKQGPDRLNSVFGWDCGPANTLLDLAIQKFTRGKLAYDRDGLIALKGKVCERTLESWLTEPFFHLPPPKSTGRQQFGIKDLERRYKSFDKRPNVDFISTLTAFSAALVKQDLRNFYALNSIYPIELLVSGGGARNPFMFNQIVQRCRGLRVLKTHEFGISVQCKEALAFALLAWWHVLKHPGNSPSVTGATRKVILGIRVDP